MAKGETNHLAEKSSLEKRRGMPIFHLAQAAIEVTQEGLRIAQEGIIDLLWGNKLESGCRMVLSYEPDCDEIIIGLERGEKKTVGVEHEQRGTLIFGLDKQLKLRTGLDTKSFAEFLEEEVGVSLAYSITEGFNVKIIINRDEKTITIKGR